MTFDNLIDIDIKADPPQVEPPPDARLLIRPRERRDGRAQLHAHLAQRARAHLLARPDGPPHPGARHLI